MCVCVCVKIARTYRGNVKCACVISYNLTHGTLLLSPNWLLYGLLIFIFTESPPIPILFTRKCHRQRENNITTNDIQKKKKTTKAFDIYFHVCQCKKIKKFLYIFLETTIQYGGCEKVDSRVCAKGGCKAGMCSLAVQF